MKLPFTLSLCAASLLAFAAASAAPAPTDTIVLRLPNKVLMTLVVQNAAQLRELKKYQLDSLTSRLAGYIAQTEAAAQASPRDQTTLRFRPDQDQPGQRLPAEIRITAHKDGAAGAGRTDVNMERPSDEIKLKRVGGHKSFIYGDEGVIAYRFRKPESAAADSLRSHHHHDGGHVGLRFDLGINTFVNQSAAGAGVPSLRHLTFGPASGYSALGLNYVLPLATHGRARPALTFGPEFTFFHFLLTGNQQWQYAGGVVSAAPAPAGKNLDYSTLSLTNLELPVMLRFRLLDKQRDNKTLSAGIGMFGGLRLGNTLETKYRLDGSDLKYDDELGGNLGLRNWQYGVQAEVGFHVLRFFARYNLNPLFEDGRGPQTHAFAAGFRLFGY